MLERGFWAEVEACEDFIWDFVVRKMGVVLGGSGVMWFVVLMVMLMGLFEE